jgi:DNA-binding transcriptional ArsR family regulator
VSIIVEEQSHQDAERQADIFSVLSNPKRLLILRLLAESEQSVGDIAQALETSLQNASHHLRLMKDKGILIRHRKGQSIFYRIAEPELVANYLEIPPDHPENQDA